MKTPSSYRQAMSQAARDSGYDDQEIAKRIGVSPGYFSRFMRATGDAWARRLVAFMLVSKSNEPLQWMAGQVGCEVLPAAEVAELKARLLKLEREGRVVA